MQIGYTMMCEQRSPKDLVDDIVLAEQAGFDFSVISDHFSPVAGSAGPQPVRLVGARRGGGAHRADRR